MLHDCHQLYYIVPEIMYSWQHILREFFVTCDTEFGRRNAHMSLVYPCTLWLGWPWMFWNITFSFWWVPENAIVHGRDSHVLLDPCYPGRNALDPFAGSRYDHGDLHLTPVRYGWLSVLRRQSDNPAPIFFSCHGGCVSIPSIEVTDEICSHRIWGPFSISNVSIIIDNKAEYFRPPAEFVEAPFCFVNGFDPFLSMTISASQSIFEW